MTPDRLSHEADSAVEGLLLKSNGRHKTANDVFEVVVAMNHDRRSDTALLLEGIEGNHRLLEEHCKENVEEFAEALGLVNTLEADLNMVKENCSKLHVRAPRRKDDPDTEDWGTSRYAEDQELGDVRRAWRFLRWVVVAILGTFIVVFGEAIATKIFNLE